MTCKKVWAVAIVFVALTAYAHADAALLMEEQFGTFGRMNPTGHAAIYLTDVCAASPTRLRRCEPGEGGVVISRYYRVAGYDWIAIPLLPYLYAVDTPSQIPQSADADSVAAFRDAYRRAHLLTLAPNTPKGGTPGGDWIQLVGASYDRKIYGFMIATSPAQDDAFMRRFNTRRNHSRFNLVSDNCADFARVALNAYFPHAIHRNFLADIGITTPKQVARSLVKYGRKHPELRFSTFVVPQVPGSLPRSHKVDGLLEAVIKTKKYVLPLAFFHPFVTSGLVATYLVEGRFNPKRNAPVFDVARVVQPPPAATPSLAANSGSASRMNATIASKRTE